MPDENGKPAPNANANGDAGGNAGEAAKTFTQADFDKALQSATDKRVAEALKTQKEQLDALLADTTKNSETKLSEFKTKAEEAERYAAFVETATGAGIRNVKAAYTVAVAHGHMAGGKFNAEKFKTENPEFFAPATRADAGAGAGGKAQKADMDTWLRTS